MSELTREQVEKMFGVGNGFKMSVWPFEIQPQTAQAFLAHDAAQRAQREQDLKRIQELAKQYADSTAVEGCQAKRIAALEQELEDNAKAMLNRDLERAVQREELATLTLALAQARGALEAIIGTTMAEMVGVAEANGETHIKLQVQVSKLKSALAALAVPAAGGGETKENDNGK